MARPTQQEIDDWNARMSEPEEPDPDDFEVVLFDNDGNPVGTMPYAKAKAYFKKRGIDFDDDPAAANAATGNAPNAAGGAAIPPQSASGARAPRATSRYFGKQAGGNPTAVDPNNLPAGSQPI